MSSDEQFTALGRPAGTPVGFQTSATNIAVGADISGNDAGIRAHCGPGVGLEADSVDSAGVLGLSQHASGVAGRSAFGVGVRGHTPSGIFGLLGSGGRAGVLGITPVATSIGGGGPDPVLEDQWVSDQSLPAQAGVIGLSNMGTGVHGHGAQVGVHGRSERGGRGGVFEGRPQARLVPQELVLGGRVRVAPESHDPAGVYLPVGGQTGDLLMTRDTTSGDAALWLCVADGDSAIPASWAEVLLAPAVGGRT